MSKLNVQKSISIETSAEQIFTILSDFSHWQNWSPWLILEKNAHVLISEDKKSYSWEGKRVGSGEMLISNENSPRRIDYNLTFLKPWRSEAKVWFELSEKENSCEVNWFMDSSLPFFMFWMKKKMEAWIGMDYIRGLFMLKDYAETGSIPSRLVTEGIIDYPGCNYVGIRTPCQISEIGPKMKNDFGRLMQWQADSGIEASNNPFSIYKKWDMIKGTAEYVAGLPVKNIVENLPEGLINGSIPTIKVYSISHIGPYRHLGNAWSMAYSMINSKEIRPNKKIDPFEVYMNMPGEVDENELVTKIYFPILY